MANTSPLKLFTYVNYDELESKIFAFKKIYRALHSAQGNTVLKTNFLEGKEILPAHELANLIEQHYFEKPKSRTAKAWLLAIKHHQNCTAENLDLFNAIYKHASDCTHYMGMTFFKAAAKEVKFTTNDILERSHINNHMGWKILIELDYNPKNYLIDNCLRSIKVN